MCGRFVVDRKSSDLISLFDVDVSGDTLPEPSWNIAPTELIAIVLDALPKQGADSLSTDKLSAEKLSAQAEPEYVPIEPVRRLEAARWGLVPSWSKDPNAGPPLFNARSEDVADKASFKTAVKKRRAVIPATGYYEWRVVDGAKVPHFISLPGDELVLFAGLYEWWRKPDATDDDPDRWLLSASILTRASAGPLADIHDRMPVFLDADLVEEWLDPVEEGSQELVDEVAAGGAEVAERMEFHEVGAAVGSVKNNSPELMAALN